MNEPNDSGALPPKDLEWQVGKTVASINFVNDAEKYLENCGDEPIRMNLEAEIKAIKNGTKVLDKFLTVEERLRQIYCW